MPLITLPGRDAHETEVEQNVTRRPGKTGVKSDEAMNDNRLRKLDEPMPRCAPLEFAST